MPERKSGSQKDMHQAAEAIDVISKAVVFALKNFGRDVAWGANLEVGGSVGGLELDGAAKVANANFSFFIGAGNKHVVDLDVAVNNIALVQGLEASGHLSNYHLSLFLEKRLVRLLHNVVEKVAASHEASHADVSLLVLERLNEFEYVGAVASDFFHDLELSKNLAVGNKGLLDDFLLNDLYGNIDAGVFVLAEDDGSERSLSEAAHRKVLVDAVVKEALGPEDLCMPVVESDLSVELD